MAFSTVSAILVEPCGATYFTSVIQCSSNRRICSLRTSAIVFHSPHSFPLLKGQKTTVDFGKCYTEEKAL